MTADDHSRHHIGPIFVPAYGCADCADEMAATDPVVRERDSLRAQVRALEEELVAARSDRDRLAEDVKGWWAKDLEAGRVEAERDALRARVAAVRALADGLRGDYGPIADEILAVLDGSAETPLSLPPKDLQTPAAETPEVVHQDDTETTRTTSPTDSKPSERRPHDVAVEPPGADSGDPHGSVSIVHAVRPAQSYVECKCGAGVFVAPGTERAWWDEHKDPYVEAPGFGATNREYWPRSWVLAQEAEEAAETPTASPSTAVRSGSGAAETPTGDDLLDLARRIEDEYARGVQPGQLDRLDAIANRLRAFAGLLYERTAADSGHVASTPALGDDEVRAIAQMVRDTTAPDPAARPIDCGELTQVWAPCPGCRQAAAGQPCACSGAWCCERHRAVDAVDDALHATGNALLDEDTSEVLADAAVKCLLARPDLLVALAGTATTPQPADVEPRWETDETRTEWAVRSTGTGGLVTVGMVIAEENARRWAVSFPAQHPEIASAEAVSRIVQRRESAWTPAPLDPLLIGTHADPEFVEHGTHHHPVDGCGYCPDEEAPK